MDFRNLDEETRKFMLDEVEVDIDNSNIYFSPRLNDKGRAEYVGLLREAVVNHSDAWLAQQILSNGHLSRHELRNTKKGVVRAKVPHNAHIMLAEGEFNRFYMRGLCSRSIAEGINALEVYRGKQVRSPRSQSQAMIGMLVSPDKLLADLRENTGTDTALGLPAGPNSGLTIGIPE